jgi:glyoxylase-like metal-dependent hydrolase (beta-lactamase superfamily II)
MQCQRWTVGDYTLTSVVETQYDRVPAVALFPEATPELVLRHDWLVPDFADARGRLLFRVQAIVIEGRGRRILVDPCVGNGKRRAVAYWHEQNFPFLERLADAGLAPESIDTVVHTHLHVDHIGWDTRLEAGAWVPTFRHARHLYTAYALAWRRTTQDAAEPAYEDSIAPIFAAGLADVVQEDAQLGEGLRLQATPGHTPGHVSLWIESAGEVALISGDFIHHPVQCAMPAWAQAADEDPALARDTRSSLLQRAAQLRCLFIGTHFPNRPAGRVIEDGDAFRFEPV